MIAAIGNQLHITGVRGHWEVLLLVQLNGQASPEWATMATAGKRDEARMLRDVVQRDLATGRSVSVKTSKGQVLLRPANFEAQFKNPLKMAFPLAQSMFRSKKRPKKSISDAEATRNESA